MCARGRRQKKLEKERERESHWNVEMERVHDRKLENKGGVGGKLEEVQEDR